MSKKVAVMLSGCGGMDGTETQEAVCSLLAIESEKMSWEAFSLDEDQTSVISAVSLEQVSQKRNMMEESARITHGKIKNIEQIDSDEFDAIWFPGGYGVVSSFSNLAEKNIEGTIHPKILSLVKEFFNKKKIIVALCIAPSLLAKSLEGNELKLTLGEEEEHCKLLQKLNHQPIKATSEEYIFDEAHNIYTSPAYMDPQASCLKVFTACKKIAKNIACD